MRKTVNQFLFILSLFVFYSCNKTAPKECFEKADSLKQQLDLSYKEFKSIPFEEYEKIQKEVKKTNKNFKTHIFNIEDQAFKTTFSQFTNIEKEYKRIFQRYKNIEDEYKNSMRQIENLKEDLKSGALYEKDKIEIYLQQEKVAIQYLTQTMKDLFLDAEKQKANFVQSKDAVEKFAEDLSKKSKK